MDTPAQSQALSSLLLPVSPWLRASDPLLQFAS